MDHTLQQNHYNFPGCVEVSKTIAKLCPTKQDLGFEVRTPFATTRTLNIIEIIHQKTLEYDMKSLVWTEKFRKKYSLGGTGTGEK